MYTFIQEKERSFMKQNSYPDVVMICEISSFGRMRQENHRKMKTYLSLQSECEANLSYGGIIWRPVKSNPTKGKYQKSQRAHKQKVRTPTNCQSSVPAESEPVELSFFVFESYRVAFSPLTNSITLLS